jgi:small subunit ribosomal protein S9
MTTTTAPRPKAGRRKEAVARVRLFPGGGQHRINGRDANEYLKRELLIREAFKALAVTQNEGKYNAEIRVHGGGVSGQAGAIRLAVARALAAEDESLRGPLGREGLLRRDARMKERKKYGQAGARKRFQFSKR